MSGHPCTATSSSANIAAATPGTSRGGCRTSGWLRMRRPRTTATSACRSLVPAGMLLSRAKGSPVTDVYSLGATVWTLLVGRSPRSKIRGATTPRMALIGRINAPGPATGQ